jgi:hypothetical protein
MADEDHHDPTDALESAAAVEQVPLVAPEQETVLLQPVEDSDIVKVRESNEDVEEAVAELEVAPAALPPMEVVHELATPIMAETAYPPDASIPMASMMEVESPKPTIKFDMLSPNAAHPSGPKDRDVIVGVGQDEHRANLLLGDLIALHRLIWDVTHDSLPKDGDADVEVLTERLFQLMKKGKGRDLAGMKDVPRPFLVGSGRFMRKEEVEWRELSDDEARQSIKDSVMAAFQADESESEETQLKALGKEFRQFVLDQAKEAETEPIAVKPTDVVLLQRTERDGDKSFDNQMGNKALFTLASQHVKTDIISPTKRLEAALAVSMSKPAGEEGPEATAEKPRFVLCDTKDGQKVCLQMNPVDAAEVTLLFVFEVWQEKELTAKPVVLGEAASDNVASIDPKPSTDPVDKPTPHDGRCTSACCNECFNRFAMASF